MRSVEMTSKSVDEARAAAAQKLGVPADSIQITVLEETKGLFGKSNVRVRAEAADVAEPAPEPVAVGAPAVAAEEKAAAPVKEKAPRRTSKAAAAKQAAVESVPLAEVQEAFEAAPPEAIVETQEAEAAADEPEVQATDEDVERLQALVEEILGAGELDVTTNASISGGRYVNIVLDGKDVAFLVGKHGEVLNALQYLLNIMAARRYHNGVRVTLDGNDYRRRREDALSKLAQQIADQVKARREEAVLDALPAFERRVVHKALSSMEGVTTYSEGEEPNRRVVIAPAE